MLHVISWVCILQDDAQAHCSDLLWGAQGSSVIIERWLLLEYCTEGCLQVCKALRLCSAAGRGYTAMHACVKSTLPQEHRLRCKSI